MRGGATTPVSVTREGLCGSSLSRPAILEESVKAKAGPGAKQLACESLCHLTSGGIGDAEKQDALHNRYLHFL